MKRNNKGFIAISLIYSFFLVFIVTLLTIVSDYAHNRILLNDVKKETQTYLNGLAEFNPVHLENREYETNESIRFGRDTWKVLEDDGMNVTLILDRNLSEEEIIDIINSTGLPNANQENKVLMCFNEYDPTLCHYQDNVTFSYYTWNTSIVKKIVEEWLLSDPTLQKAIQIGNLQNMNFSDGEKIYSAYVRIPINTEYTTLQDENIWYLTKSSAMDGMSYLSIGSLEISSHNTYKEIKPVIMVQKTILLN